MWECGLKSPQAEEASNPSLNGGPSAVARNAVDHRLSCLIDSSPLSVAKTIRMPLHPLPAAAPPQGSAPALSPALSPPPCRGPLQASAASPCGFSSCFTGVSAETWSSEGKAKGDHPSRAAPLYFWVKKVLSGCSLCRSVLSQQFGTKGLFFFWLGLKLDSCSQCTMKRDPAGSCCGPGAFLGGVCMPWQTKHLLTSPLSLHGSRALIRADEAGASLVFSAVLPTGDTYWATTVIPLSPRGLLSCAWDWSGCELCSHYYMVFGL